MQTILKQIKERGEQHDLEIAATMRIPLSDVRMRLSGLLNRGDVVMCRSTRFDKGREIEGMRRRLAGHPPVASPGRKPNTKTRDEV